MERKVVGRCRICLEKSFLDQDLVIMIHRGCRDMEDFRRANHLCIFCGDKARKEDDDDIIPVSRRLSTCEKCDIRHPSGFPIQN